MEFMFWLGAGIVAGAVAGAALAWWYANRRVGGATIAQLKRENEAFKNEVTEHFVETARLINQLTDSYKAVFDHLSSGADQLVDDKALAEKMPRVSGREVRLRHLGAPETGRGPGSGTDPLKSSGAGDNADSGKKGAQGQTGSGTSAGDGAPKGSTASRPGAATRNQTSGSRGSD